MIQIKKTILTLVALLAVTTGAWADETPLVTINSTGYTTFTSGSKTFDDKVTVTFSNSVSNDGDHWGWYTDGTASLLTVAGINGYTITSCKFYTFDGTAKTGYTVAGESPSVYLNNDYVYTDDSKSENLGKFGISKIEVYGGVASAATDPNAVTAAEINSDLYSGWSSIDEKLLKASDLPGFQAVTENQAKSWTGVPSTGRVKLFYDFVADGNVKVVIFNNGVYDSSYEEEELTCYLIYEDIKYDGDTKYFYTTGPAPSGPEVEWNAANKTGTFKMPGGNVTLEPEYYPQAALTTAPTAINDVPATTDGAIVSAGTVANIGETTNAQGTVMYYVSPTALDDAALQALAADQWTADVPTAAGLAQGQAYVYYYVRGNDSDTDAENFSDGDILATNAVTVTIAAEPTYAVTFAEGTEESDKWSAEPNADVKKGQTVTVTYTGSKKVIGVKAEKKAATKTLAEATLEDIGKIAGADGNIYDSKADAEAANTTAVAMIAYVGTASDCAHGLAIALADESDKKNYGAAGTACSGKAAVTGGTWRLPSIKDWQYMLIGCGASESYKDNPGAMGYSGLASKLTTAQGNALVQGVSYWSSTGNSADYSWRMYINGSNVNFTLDYKGNDLQVRACFAF